MAASLEWVLLSSMQGLLYAVSREMAVAVMLVVVLLVVVLLAPMKVTLTVVVIVIGTADYSY